MIKNYFNNDKFYKKIIKVKERSKNNSKEFKKDSKI